MRRRGVSLTEVLAASLIIAVAIAGMYQAWMFSFSSIDSTDQRAVAAHIARSALDSIKAEGAGNLPTGTLVSATANPLAGTYTGPTIYFDRGGAWVDSASEAVFQLVVSSADSNVMGSSTGYVIGGYSKRSVTATVSKVSDGAVVYTMGTILYASGI